MNKNFSITNGRGFQIRFANGYTISVQFGPAIYCDNYDLMARISYINFDAVERQAGREGCNNAECAIWSGKGNNRKFLDLSELIEDAGEVAGYCSPEQVLMLMNYAASLPAFISVKEDEDAKDN